jgi:predicted Zn finger-like uncharacterized protein
MKRITKCPQCSTAFRVHEEQLTARQGKVRCGACGHVFDAFGSLIESKEDDSPSPLPPATHSSSAEKSPATPPEMPDTSSAYLSIGAATVWPNAANKPKEDPTPSAQPKPASPQSTQPIAATSAQVKSVAPVEQNSTRAQATIVSEPVDQAFDFGSEPADQRSGKGWKISVALMSLLIVLQATYWLRGLIAATFPETQPVIIGLCGAIGCTVPLPRQSDKLTLESSDLQFEQSDLLSFTATIRNRGSIGQAYPSLLLTLTDQRNRPIARRAIHPAEYLGLQPTGVEMIAAAGTLTAQVQIDGRSLGATGYEVLVFYP